jgi:hypothetical protein
VVAKDKDKTEGDGEDQAWNGMAVLLWPVLAYWKVKVWVHNLLHPDDPQQL